MVHKKKKKILIDGEIFESNEVKKYLKKFLYSKFVDKKKKKWNHCKFRLQKQ